MSRRHGERFLILLALAGIAVAMLPHDSYSTSRYKPSAFPTSPALEQPPAEPTVAPPAAPIADFEQALKAHIAGSPFTIGVAVYDAQSQQPLARINADIVMFAASVVKLPLVMAVYAESAAGRIHLDDTIPIDEQDQVPGSGELQGAPPGSRWTIRELCKRALEDSDNTASNRLLRLLGVDTLRAWLDSQGLKATRIDRPYFADPGTGAIETSASDMAHALMMLDTAAQAGEGWASEILAYLEAATWDEGLRSGLPETFRLQHKYGLAPGVAHDAGIVLVDSSHRYVVAIMTSGDGTSPAQIRQVAEVVYHELCQNQALRCG